MLYGAAAVDFPTNLKYEFGQRDLETKLRLGGYRVGGSSFWVEVSWATFRGPLD